MSAKVNIRKHIISRESKIKRFNMLVNKQLADKERVESCLGFENVNESLKKIIPFTKS